MAHAIDRESCQEPLARNGLAPCIAIVGPANSGKTTLINLLDRALHRHPEQPMTYVVKGSPDGTGRYLLHAPELREALKGEVKGRWIPETAATIGAWIAACRNHVELVLLDLGGKHDEKNDYLLEHCSHFLVLARRFDAPEDEARDGVESWRAVCERAGLLPVALLRSTVSGEAAIAQGADGVLEGTIRGDVPDPKDPAQAGAIDALVDRLLSLRVRRPLPGYLMLKRPWWSVADLPDLGGRGTELDRMAASGTVALGGAAPIWTYATAMHRVLDRAPGARVLVFDPKVVSGFVEVPPAPVARPGSPLARRIDLGWSIPADRGAGAALRLRIVTEDRWLPPMAFDMLATAPPPPEPLPEGALWVDGAGPIWLHLAYSRWLRARAPGRDLGVWDASQKGVVFVTGPSAPSFEPRAAAAPAT